MQQVFVHGLGQTPASWQKTIAQMSCTGQTICPDLAALLSGREVSYQSLYRAFADSCNQAAQPIDLCGLSLGGVLALQYALEQPEKVGSLVLIATPYRMPKRLLKLQNLLFRLLPEAAFAQMGWPKAAVLRLCASMAALDFSHSLQAVACPVMVLCGARDRANKKASRHMAGMLRNAELHIIEGAGHEVNRDAPEKLAAALDAFYQRSAPPAVERETRLIG